MQNKRLFILILLLLNTPLITQAKLAKDSLSNSWVILPVAFYTTETNIGLGISGGIYFTKEKNTYGVSSIQGISIYTLNAQTQINISPNWYWQKKKLNIKGNFSYFKYPINFYGIGNSIIDENKVKITPQYFISHITGQYFINQHIMAGLQFYERNEKITSTPKKISQIIGAEHYNAFGVGALFTYDTRDNRFYARKGLFLKVSWLQFLSKLFSSYNFSQSFLDTRFYLPINTKSSFAFQFYTAQTFGKVPFQLLSKIGGIDLLRGYYAGKFRDNNSAVLQLEYRRKIYKKISGTLFGGIGIVEQKKPPIFNEKSKIAGGMGLRYKINPEKVHLRGDIAINRDKKIFFYFTALEAF